MKTTLEISDHLLRRAKALAVKRGTTLRSVTEEGLRKVLDDAASARTVRLKPVTFKGRGLTTEFEEAPWSKVRDAAYGEP